MWVNVIKKFKDKHTKVIHEIGETIEVTRERYEDINSTSFGVFVIAIEKTPIIYGVDLSEQEDLTVINGNIVNTKNFSLMTKAELIAYGESKKIELKMNMTKAEMIELLKE